MQSFNFIASSSLHVGLHSIFNLKDIIRQYGQKVLLVTGKSSFESIPVKNKILSELSKNHIHFVHFATSGEPTIIIINNAIQTFKDQIFDCVVAIGGGSVLDTGKALSAMLPLAEPIENYLEGLPTFRQHPGLKIPFIAIPTTTGTGSEATKNAVISKPQPNGFKRSIRHNNFIANHAIIDPQLYVSCPRNVIAASGLDAFTQLLEAYFSSQANLLTDTLALKGIELVNNSLLKVYSNPNNLSAWYNIAIAAYLSGVVLANAGLGVVHGFASAIGGLLDIPHGVICGRLLPICFRKNLELIVLNYSKAYEYNILSKIHHLARILLPHQNNNSSIATLVDNLCNELDRTRDILNIPKLRNFGLSNALFNFILNHTSMKNNPVSLDKNTLYEILKSEL